MLYLEKGNFNNQRGEFVNYFDFISLISPSKCMKIVKGYIIDLPKSELLTMVDNYSFMENNYKTLLFEFFSEESFEIYVINNVSEDDFISE